MLSECLPFGLTLVVLGKANFAVSTEMKAVTDFPASGNANFAVSIESKAVTDFPASSMVSPR